MYSSLGMFDGTRPLCLSPQAEFQQVPTFLGQKEDETPGLFKSCTVRVSGRDSGVCAAGTYLGTVQSWGGMGTGTVLASMRVVTLRKLAQLSTAQEVLGLF